MRRGTATLELVLSLPILLAVIVGIIWLGFSVVGQAEVTVTARHEAWQKRSEPAGTALLFLKDDVVTADSTTTIDISPVFQNVDSPESSHDVMTNSWDHESLTLDAAPNWKQYAIAAANAKTGGLQTNYVDAQNRLNQFQGEAANAWQTIAVSLIRDITRFGSQAGSGLAGGRDSKASESAERAKINRQLTAKRRELQNARQQLRELDDDASDALRDVLKNKVERLKAEVNDLEADRKALD
jgi:hypothetical protein